MFFKKDTSKGTKIFNNLQCQQRIINPKDRDSFSEGVTFTPRIANVYLKIILNLL